MLTKSKMLYGIFAEPAGAAVFMAVADVETKAKPARVLHLDRQRWEDMGRPEEITVTVEPGNTMSE